MTITSEPASQSGLIGFLERTLAEFARLAWVLSGVCDPSVVPMPRCRPASRGAR